jgi:hypothetical protein
VFTPLTGWHCKFRPNTKGAAKNWLTAMASAAEQTNITVQYCMALPRHILQSASFPRVSHARATHDYGQSKKGNSEQWSKLGVTSILYWSIGLIPFKDDFWSEMVEPGNEWGTNETDPELETIVSLLSAGPVGTVRGYRQEIMLEDAIGFHACSIEASMRVTNNIHLGCPLFLPGHTVNCLQTLEGPADGCHSGSH